MTDALRRLQAATRPTADSGVAWAELVDAMRAVVATQLTPSAERTLLAVLRSTHRMSLAEGGELPHSMPPEAMLKSLAAQSLVRQTGDTYLRDIRLAEATTSSPALRSILRGLAKQAKMNPPAAVDTTVLTAASLRIKREIAAGWLGGWVEQVPQPSRLQMVEGLRKVRTMVQFRHGLSLATGGSPKRYRTRHTRGSAATGGGSVMPAPCMVPA